MLLQQNKMKTWLYQIKAKEFQCREQLPQICDVVF